MTAKKISPGRGRPRAFDTEQAVETAMELFHARGYDAVGVAELSAAMGVKPPSLYAAFGSKKGLFERVLKHYLAGEGGFVRATMAEEGSLAEVVGRLFRRAAEAYGAPGGLTGCLVLDSTRNCSDPEVCEVAAQEKTRSREAILKRIAEDYPAEAGSLADYVGVVLAGLSAAARDGMPAAALKRTAEIAAAGFAAQLAGKPPKG